MKTLSIALILLPCSTFARESLAGPTVYTRQHDVLAAAIRNGSSSGVMEGEVAEHFTRQFRATVPLLVAVKADSPYRTLADLIAAARAKPEGVTFASASSSQRVATESLAAAAGIKMLYVPYRSSPLAVQDLLSGRVDLFIADQAVILPQAQAGALRILAVTSGERSAAVPDVPTVREAGGLAEYEVIAWFALFVPAGTPADRVAKLNAATVASLALPEVRQRLGTFGMNIRPSTPAEAVAFVRAETVKWTNAIRQAGIEPE